MANGLKPIGESIKPIIERIKKEREERRKRKSNKPIRTQPKLPGMKKGGSAKKSKAMVISIGIGKAKDYPGMKEIMKKNKKGKKKFVKGGIAFGGEKRIPGSGAATKGTGFKGIF